MTKEKRIYRLEFTRFLKAKQFARWLQSTLAAAGEPDTVTIYIDTDNGKIVVRWTASVDKE